MDEKTALAALARNYLTIHMIDIKANTIEPISTAPEIMEIIGDGTNAQDCLYRFVENFTAPTSSVACREFDDLKEVQLKLMETEKLALVFKDHHNEWCRSSFIRMDEKAVPEQVLFVIENINNDMLQKIDRENELEDALAQARNASDAKTSFLFNMSHDIRTPLNAISGFITLAQKTDDDEERTSYLSKTKQATDQLTDILNNVLEMARIEKGNLTVENELVDAQDLFNSELIIFENRLIDKNITLIINNEIKHNYLYADRTLLAEVYLNLLSNAYKYTPEGGKIILTSVELESDKPGMCIVETTIEDNGIGMSKEFIEQAFDEFKRDRNEQTINVQGTGLGLAIVKRLVALMDGTIKVTSELGAGTKFTMRIPHRYGNPEDLTNQKIDDEQKSYEVLRGKRVLMAEDNDLNAEITTVLLESCGIIVERAVNGMECVRMIHENMPTYYDMVLMDIQMPVMDGFKATHEIRSMVDYTKANIPIVALSANAFKEDILKSRMAGMNDHLAKPISSAKLQAAMAEIFEKDYDVPVAQLLAENNLNYYELRASDVGTYVIDNVRRILFWNEAATRMTGYAAQYMLGQHCFSSGLKHEDISGCHLCNSKCPLMATILDGKSRTERVSAFCTDAQRRWFTVSTQALYHNGQIYGAVERFS